MFSVGVRDHVMIAHSLEGTVFGPAQRLHGATYVIDLELRRAELDRDATVADIGLLTELLKSVLRPYAYRNLDDLPEFDGRNSTVEEVARSIGNRVRDQIRDGALGVEDRHAFDSVKVTLNESHIAWASYETSILG